MGWTGTKERGPTSSGRPIHPDHPGPTSKSEWDHVQGTHHTDLCGPVCSTQSWCEGPAHLWALGVGWQRGPTDKSLGTAPWSNTNGNHSTSSLVNRNQTSPVVVKVFETLSTSQGPPLNLVRGPSRRSDGRVCLLLSLKVLLEDFGTGTGKGDLVYSRLPCLPESHSLPWNHPKTPLDW